MTKHYTLFFCFAVVSNINFLYAQTADLNHIWAHSFGSSAGDAGASVTSDEAGNVYFVGRFNNTVNFDPHQIADPLISNGGRDIYFAKYNSSGELVWARSLGNPSSSLHDDGASIAVDRLGNVYVAGFFSGKVDFDPGPDTAFITAPTVSARYNGIFFAKYDSAGHYVWAKGVTGMNMGINGGFYSIALDNVGSLYLTGSYTALAPVDFDPGPDTAWLPNATNDIFLARYDTSGNFKWANRLTSTGINRALAIAANELGHVYITGQFGSPTDSVLDFDPSPTVAELKANGTNDIFLARYDSAGNYVWAINMGGPLADVGQALALDSNSNIYVTGVFRGLADFDPSATTVNLQAKSGDDVFLALYDSSGNYKWAKQISGAGNEKGNGIGLDQYSNIYIIGTFSDTVDFDPGPDSVKIGRQGGDDIFVAKYDPSGNFLNARNMGGTGTDDGVAITVTPVGVVYATGSFSGTANFNISGPSPANLVTAGGIDIFLASVGCAQSTEQIHITCDSSFTLNGLTYYESGNYIQRFTNVAGCDSQIVLKLIINHTPVQWINESTCDSFVFNGNNYHQTGIYADTFLNRYGCDSVIVLNLTVLTSDTTITLTACDSIVFNGSVIKTSGTHVQKKVNAAGCDSTILLHLTLFSSPSASIVQTGTLLTSGNAEQYQWINCDDHSNIPGATSQTFEPSITGNYAVVVTNSNNCLDTSECYFVEIDNNSVSTTIAQSHVQLYPNPSGNQLVLSAMPPLSHAAIRIINITGQVLQEWEHLNGNQIVLDISKHPSGIYLVEISDIHRTTKIRLIKD